MSRTSIIGTVTPLKLIIGPCSNAIWFQTKAPSLQTRYRHGDIPTKFNASLNSEISLKVIFHGDYLRKMSRKKSQLFFATNICSLYKERYPIWQF